MAEGSESDSPRAADLFCDEVANLAREYRDEKHVTEWVLSNQLRYLRECIERGEL